MSQFLSMAKDPKTHMGCSLNSNPIAVFVAIVHYAYVNYQ